MIQILSSIKAHVIEFLVMCVFLGGLLYSITTSYQTSYALNHLESRLTEVSTDLSTKLISVESNLKKIKIVFAKNKLKNNDLSEKDLEEIISKFDKTLELQESKVVKALELQESIYELSDSMRSITQFREQEDIPKILTYLKDESAKLEKDKEAILKRLEVLNAAMKPLSEKMDDLKHVFEVNKISPELLSPELDTPQ